jgi:hypothetical protein
MDLRRLQAADERDSSTYTVKAACLQDQAGAEQETQSRAPAEALGQEGGTMADELKEDIELALFHAVGVSALFALELDVASKAAADAGRMANWRLGDHSIGQVIQALRRVRAALQSKETGKCSP